MLRYYKLSSAGPLLEITPDQFAEMLQVMCVEYRNNCNLPMTGFTYADAAYIVLESPDEPLEDELLTEDYPGQKDEIRRERLIKQAVHSGDSILMQGANGSVEELDYLTSATAKAWVEKVHSSVTSKLLKHDLEERHGTNPSKTS